MRGLDEELRSRMRGLIEAMLRRLAEESSEQPSEEETPDEAPALEPVASTPPVDTPDLGHKTWALDDTLTIPVLEAEPEPFWELEAEHEPAPVLEQPMPRRLERRPIAYSLAILIVGAAVAVGIWQLSIHGGSAKGAPTTLARAGATNEALAAPDTAAIVEAAVRKPAPVLEPAAEPRAGAAPAAKLVLRAATGESWVLVRSGSAKGKVIYEGFLKKGTSREFAGKRLWVRLGAAHRLTATLNGRPVTNLPAGTADVIVTARRLQAV